MVKLGPGGEDDNSRMLLQNDRFFINYKANQCITFSNEKYIANESNMIENYSANIPSPIKDNDLLNIFKGNQKYFDFKPNTNNP